MANKLRLEGKVAVITGAASGIGEATARLFVEHGARVVIADIQDELGHQVVASIGTDKASYRHCDVTDEKQVEDAVAYAVEIYGTLDIMFSNAGTLGTLSSVLDMDMTVFDQTMTINARGSALAVKHAARVMVTEKIQGSIICTASVEAILAGAAPLAYVASKHAILGVVKAAARELGQHGIRVNCVSPYGIATPMVCKTFGGDAAPIEASICGNANLKGITLSTKHIAEAALFLASDESAYVSAHNLAVDGGLSSIMKLD
ncbi:short-chain dehydrogenase reductase 3b-like [Nicotiana tabacum]|uniref:Short-chain dehydrogenase reductase 3b-like n=1 Tax=Nicotiana tabacum TaxID=4097 RepID=A0A1S3YAV4_TOBAC|nr:short-chain dehydrogenase reductase 3b-like [Nicotiana tomentosiformis]XP_016449143.1 PREDICTED: short-chain dehydrogenase reductase 3b-like [Nicotiana tabacum]